MPQMMPINWMFSFVFFLFAFIMFNIMNYYIFNLKLNDMKNNKKIIKNNLYWKW